MKVSDEIFKAMKDYWISEGIEPNVMYHILRNFRE